MAHAISYFVCLVLVTQFIRDVILQVSQEPMPVSQSCLICIRNTFANKEPNCSVDPEVEELYKNNFKEYQRRYSLLLKGNGACGPYRISRPYWLDSSSPTVNGELPQGSNQVAFINCVTNYDCATLTVQGYMSKQQKDCNGDNKIDCDDFIKLHLLGNHECVKDLSSVHERRYRQCKMDTLASINKV